MFSGNKVTEIFCLADDFCKFFDSQVKKYTLTDQKSKRQIFLLQLYKMERQELLNIIKSLHNGDRIHVEYKPFFRSNYVIDTKFLGLRCVFVAEGGWLMHSRGNDYDSLIADMYDSLFRYFKLECAGSDGVSVIKIHLRRIKQLKIIG